MVELWELADSVKDKEYRELFPDMEPEEAKQERQLVEEALFQVHYVVWNEDLYEEIQNTDEYWIPQSKVEELSTDDQIERFKKATRGATIKEEDGEVLIPIVDIEDALSPRPGLRD